MFRIRKTIVLFVMLANLAYAMQPPQSTYTEIETQKQKTRIILVRYKTNNFAIRFRTQRSDSLWEWTAPEILVNNTRIKDGTAKPILVKNDRITLKVHAYKRAIDPWIDKLSVTRVCKEISKKISPNTTVLFVAPIKINYELSFLPNGIRRIPKVDDITIKEKRGYSRFQKFTNHAIQKKYRQKRHSSPIWQRQYYDPCSTFRYLVQNTNKPLQLYINGITLPHGESRSIRTDNNIILVELKKPCTDSEESLYSQFYKIRGPLIDFDIPQKESYFDLLPPELTVHIAGFVKFSLPSQILIKTINSIERPAKLDKYEIIVESSLLEKIKIFPL